ncbi:hypothetical protein ABIA69_002128 [Lysinibacillus parviboronicapiens]|uniref:Uncharacterized protein n=1 Tax=Lysinibacillus parviboronicapiens TaxID=436516 RepID=A0ABV2PJ54_9BACI
MWVVSYFSAGVLLKEIKASGGCYGIGKEFFVQAKAESRRNDAGASLNERCCFCCE